jgi:ubiquinone/menaquinone biosynthesis C-methylase UbiE
MPKRKVDKDDNTAYSTKELWESRQIEINNKTAFTFAHEWYYSYEDLEPLLSDCIADGMDCLEIGCGFKPLVEGIAKGLAKEEKTGTFIGIDFAPAVVTALVAGNSLENVSYEVMDARHMTKFTDCSQDLIIEKATIDAMLCSDKWSENVELIMTEICRVLKPTGHIVIISHMEFDGDEFQSILTETIVPLFNARPALQWALEVHAIGGGEGGEQMGVKGGRAGGATVYIFSARPRRLTRHTLSTHCQPAPLQISVKTYGDSSDEEDDDKDEESDNEQD